MERSYDGAKSSDSSPLFGSPDGYDEQEFSKDDPATITDNYLPCHYFDYIGGTSMGGYSIHPFCNASFLMAVA